MSKDVPTIDWAPLAPHQKLVFEGMPEGTKICFADSWAILAHPDGTLTVVGNGPVRAKQVWDTDLHLTQKKPYRT